MMHPNVETGYAQSGDVAIAYQIVGHGVPVVFVPGFISHVELNWDVPWYARALNRTVRFGRLLVFDKRGTGMSDRVDVGTPEERMEDIRAVMDAAGFERAAVVGVSEGGPLAILFAATYPERVDKLVLYGSFAKAQKAPDYPAGIDAASWAMLAQMVEASWGTGMALKLFAQRAPDPINEKRILSRFERMSATPATAGAILRQDAEIDVRDALPRVKAPALVVHAKDDPLMPSRHGCYLAEHLPNARYIEVEGAFHVSWREDDQDRVLDPIEEFIVGSVRTAGPKEDRTVASLLMTDIVGSTRRVAELGDAVWRGLLNEHDRIARAAIAKFGGRFVAHTGDGVFASFDAPLAAVECARFMCGALEAVGMPIRSGVHVGEVEFRGDNLAGVNVHLAARVMSVADAGQVAVTDAVRAACESADLTFADLGQHAMKGIDGPVAVWNVSRSQDA